VTDLQIIGLAEGWLAHWRAEEGSREREASMWASERVWDLARNAPEDALHAILAILSRDGSTEILEVLSAGPLEDLLAYNGEAIIAKVEAEARRNSAFAGLLGGVWKNRMSDHVWARVQAVWDRRGWDGESEA
jgi:hypothetical protein